MACITNHRAKAIIGIACSDLRNAVVAENILRLCQRAVGIECLLLNGYGVSLEFNRDTRFSLAAQADSFVHDFRRLECRRQRTFCINPINLINGKRGSACTRINAPIEEQIAIEFAVCIDARIHQETAACQRMRIDDRSIHVEAEVSGGIAGGRVDHEVCISRGCIANERHVRRAVLLIGENVAIEVINLIRHGAI